MNKTTKIQYFEYFINKLYEELGSENDLSIIKSLKLLFFACTFTNERGQHILLSQFDEFSALPYGPVELTIYEAIKSDNLNYFKITRSKTELKVPFTIKTDDEFILQEIDKALGHIKKFNLHKSTSTYLVELSHYYESWSSAYRVALSKGMKIEKMKYSTIREEKKYYSL